MARTKIVGTIGPATAIAHFGFAEQQVTPVDGAAAHHAHDVLHAVYTAGNVPGLILSGFLDAGRVWPGTAALAQVFADLHLGYGGGVRFAMGESFVVAVDVGFSGDELIDADGAAGSVPMGLYIGLGYLF